MAETFVHQLCTHEEARAVLSRAGADTSPLAHTFTGRVVYLKISDRYAAEFLMNAYGRACCACR